MSSGVQPVFQRSEIAEISTKTIGEEAVRRVPQLKALWELRRFYLKIFLEKKRVVCAGGREV